MDKLCDIVSERGVLSGLFQYGEDGFAEIEDIIQIDTFTNNIHQGIYKACEYLFKKQGATQIDQASLFSALQQLNLNWIIDMKESQLHLRAIMNGKILIENVRRLAARIRKLQIARMLCQQLEYANVEIQSIDGNEPIEQIIGIAENTIFDFTSLLTSTEKREPQLIGDGIYQYLDDIEANPCEIVGISSGFGHYDLAIGGGFRRKTVSLITARMKVGKSLLAANIALHVSKNLNIPVLYLDTEMSKEDHWSRILPNLAYDYGARITINDVETGKYSNKFIDKQRIRQSAEDLTKVPFYYLNISGMPFEEMLSIMRRWTNKVVGLDENGRRKDCLIIFDYLKMMTSQGISESLKEYQILGFMTSSLHNFAVNNDVPILTLCQLNRDGVDRESTDVVSGSDRILWLVTNFSIYKVKTDEEIAQIGPEHGTRKLIPISSRHGAGMEFGDYINVHFDGKYGRIKEGDTKNNLKNKANNTDKNSLIPTDVDNDILARTDTENK